MTKPTTTTATPNNVSMFPSPLRQGIKRGMHHSGQEFVSQACISMRCHVSASMLASGASRWGINLFNIRLAALPRIGRCGGVFYDGVEAFLVGRQRWPCRDHALASSTVECGPVLCAAGVAETRARGNGEARFRYCQSRDNRNRRFLLALASTKIAPGRHRQWTHQFASGGPWSGLGPGTHRLAPSLLQYPAIESHFEWHLLHPGTLYRGTRPLDPAGRS